MHHKSSIAKPIVRRTSSPRHVSHVGIYDVCLLPLLKFERTLVADTTPGFASLLFWERLLATHSSTTSTMSRWALRTIHIVISGALSSVRFQYVKLEVSEMLVRVLFCE